jgi:hypothetical protein
LCVGPNLRRFKLICAAEAVYCYTAENSHHLKAQNPQFQEEKISSSSSSFIEPPATGHHCGQGLKKNILDIIFLYDTITMAGND